jgi:V8-like Glu-specific endopeptidase
LMFLTTQAWGLTIFPEHQRSALHYIFKTSPFDLAKLDLDGKIVTSGIKLVPVKEGYVDLKPNQGRIDLKVAEYMFERYLARSVYTAYQGRAQGSAFLVGPNLVMTNKHVIGFKDSKYGTQLKCNDFKIKTHHQKTYSCHKVHYCGKQDYCLVEVANSKLPSLDKLSPPLDFATEYWIGSKTLLFMIGNSGGWGIQGSSSRSHGFDKVIKKYLYNEKHILYHKIPSYSGSSGSPIFNQQGQVVGINFATNTDGIVASGGIVTNFAVQTRHMLYHLKRNLPASVYKKLSFGEGVSQEEVERYFESLTEAAQDIKRLDENSRDILFDELDRGSTLSEGKNYLKAQMSQTLASHELGPYDKYFLKHSISAMKIINELKNVYPEYTTYNSAYGSCAKAKNITKECFNSKIVDIKKARIQKSVSRKLNDRELEILINSLNFNQEKYNFVYYIHEVKLTQQQSKQLFAQTLESFDDISRFSDMVFYDDGSHPYVSDAGAKSYMNYLSNLGYTHELTSADSFNVAINNKSLKKYIASFEKKVLLPWKKSWTFINAKKNEAFNKKILSEWCQQNDFQAYEQQLYQALSEAI